MLGGFLSQLDMAEVGVLSAEAKASKGESADLIQKTDARALAGAARMPARCKASGVTYGVHELLKLLVM